VVSQIAGDDDATGQAPNIDGMLDDVAWQQASWSSGFWNSIQDQPPSDQTEVLTLTDGEFLYVGLRMHDSNPASIQATRTVRDGGLGYDDAITIELDPFFNRRDISEFSLNPIGTQSDQIAGGRSTKIEWKGDWLGSAVETEYGWSAEFAIPFAILNYEEGATRFGVNFKRYQARTREYSYWANVTPQSLEEEMGQLDQLVLPSESTQDVLTFMPFALAGRNIPDEKGNIQQSMATGGIDIRYQPRADLTGVVALNPDFSQVEEAITDISFSYAEKSLDENRPFFAEGTEYFSPDDDDNQYFYSNRVPDFDGGAKSFGRAGRARYGALATFAPDNRWDVVARTLYEVDETNSAIATFVNTNRTGFENMLGVGQFRGRQSWGLNYSIDAALTNTKTALSEDLPNGRGNHYAASIGWRGDYVYATASADEYDRDYFPANALLEEDLPGTRGASVIAGVYREMSNPVLRVIQGYVGGDRRDTQPGLKQRQQGFVGGSVEFTNDIRVSTHVEAGPYRPLADERGQFEAEFNDDRYSSVSIDFFTRSNLFSGGVLYAAGDLGGGPYEYLSAYGWWRPLNAVFVQLSAERTESFGTFDQFVVVSSWDITAEHSLSGRFIHSDFSDYYRVAYSHRPRRGLDIFGVYDKNSFDVAKFSVKVVMAL
jgi:hypothetical protein